MRRPALSVCLLLALGAADARAGLIVRIGDIDGFGYGAANGLHAANGGNAKVTGTGVLGNQDFLPDLNRNGSVATGSHDEFDFRTAAEIANTSNALGTGVTNLATVGSKYTDISLAQSYDSRRAAGKIVTAVDPVTGALTHTAGGPFPDGNSNRLPNQPGFVFSFDIAKGQVDTSAPIFFNLVFGDFDVLPASILITRADGTKRTINLFQQNNTIGQDGLIQAATATLSFSDLYTDGGSEWKGYLKVDFIAPNEPYTAFDYVDLNTTALVSAVPEPSTMALGAIGMLLTGIRARRRRLASVC